MSYFLRFKNHIHEPSTVRKAEARRPAINSMEDAIAEAERRTAAEEANHRAAGLRPMFTDERKARVRDHLDNIIAEAKTGSNGFGGGVQSDFNNRMGLPTLAGYQTPYDAPSGPGAVNDSDFNGMPTLPGYQATHTAPNGPDGVDDGDGGDDLPNPALNSTASGPRDDGQGKSNGKNPAKNSTAGGFRDDGNGRNEVRNPAANDATRMRGKGITMSPLKKTRVRKSGGSHPLDHGVLDLSHLWLPAAR